MRSVALWLALLVQCLAPRPAAAPPTWHRWLAPPPLFDAVGDAAGQAGNTHPSIPDFFLGHNGKLSRGAVCFQTKSRRKRMMFKKKRWHEMTPKTLFSPPPKSAVSLFSFFLHPQAEDLGGGLALMPYFWGELTPFPSLLSFKNRPQSPGGHHGRQFMPIGFRMHRTTSCSPPQSGPQ